jgi:hypothetical protein
MSLARLSGSCVISSYALKAGSPDVGEQIANGDTVLVRSGPLGDAEAAAAIDVEAGVVEAEDVGGGAVDDDELVVVARQVPQRALIRSRRGCPIELADAIFGEDAVVRSDDGERAREGAVGTGAVQHVFDAALKRRAQGRCGGWCGRRL